MRGGAAPLWRRARACRVAPSEGASTCRARRRRCRCWHGRSRDTRCKQTAACRRRRGTAVAPLPPLQGAHCVAGCATAMAACCLDANNLQAAGCTQEAGRAAILLFLSFGMRLAVEGSLLGCLQPLHAGRRAQTSDGTGWSAQSADNAERPSYKGFAARHSITLSQALCAIPSGSLPQAPAHPALDRTGWPGPQRWRSPLSVNAKKKTRRVPMRDWRHAWQPTVRMLARHVA